MARGIISVFGAYLNARNSPASGDTAEEEWRSLLTQLQDTNVLALPLLPEELRIAIGHIDNENPARTLGYVREAFVRACSFVRAYTMS
jgi:hypothetical protein